MYMRLLKREHSDGGGSHILLHPPWSQNSLPTGLLSMRLLRDVYRRENVTLVHGHSAYSTLCHEALLAARLLNIPVRDRDRDVNPFPAWPSPGRPFPT